MDTQTKKISRKRLMTLGAALLVASVAGVATRERVRARVSYLISNFSADRSLNATVTSLDQVAQVLATHLDDHNKGNW
jgi:hypothetical protein